MPPKALQYDPNLKRPSIVGSETELDSGMPLYLEGIVSEGYGRGGKQLGCPTANLPEASVPQNLPTGVYYGWAQVIGPEHDYTVYPMVMSLGYNPFYNNETKTAEIHIIHTFEKDFYGSVLKSVVLGYIRPEYDYPGIEALIQDIDIDKSVALASLNRSLYSTYKQDPIFSKQS